MNTKPERGDGSLSRTVELAHHDDQVIGASIFLSVPELRAIGIDIRCVDRLLFEIIETHDESVIRLSGQTGSERGNGNNSLTD